MAIMATCRQQINPPSPRTHSGIEAARQRIAPDRDRDRDPERDDP
jgi:hypothetical protein